MGYFYFPKAENLRKLTLEEVSEIEVGIANLKGKLPWGIEDPNDFEFYEDSGMTLDNGIMGYTKFFGNRILLSSDIVSALKWKDTNGIPNNEMAMGIVVHELTHCNQMKWVFGLAWLILNIPIIDFFIEKWAKQNEQVATQSLLDTYDQLRNN